MWRTRACWTRVCCLFCGFDSVDDESVPEVVNLKVHPEHWDNPNNPPYAMWAYYIYANLFVLNKLREERGFNTFAFRPHAGEAGSPEHLGATFLVAQSINHGILLKKHPVLQYLYYITQIGLSVSPLSNNVLFVEHDKNPFPQFLASGLNVTLSTDDPLMIHYTKDPLIEEYAIAAQVWKLSSIDMSEVARNSVYQSGFDARIKEKWLGTTHERRGVAGNNVHKTNLPNVRLAFRSELHEEELRFIAGFYLNGNQIPANVPQQAQPEASDSSSTAANGISHVKKVVERRAATLPPQLHLSPQISAKFFDLMQVAVPPTVLRSKSMSSEDIQDLLHPERRPPLVPVSPSVSSSTTVDPTSTPRTPVYLRAPPMNPPQQR